MLRRLPVVAAGILTGLLLLGLSSRSGLGQPALKAAASDASVRTFLAKHCVECHGPTSQKGELRLDTLSLNVSDRAAAEKWKAVHERLQAGTMPPAKKPRPAKAELDAVNRWLEPQLALAERDRQKAEGRVVLRRLNRIEYENTLRDLLGVAVDVKELLPADAISHGFDNLGDSLNISDVQMQRYLEAADTALAAAIVREPKPEPTKRTYSLGEGRGAENIGKFWLKRPDGAVVVFAGGTFPSTQISAFRAAARGWYRLKVKGYAFQSEKPVGFAFYYGNFGRGGDTRLEGYHQFPPGEPGGVVDVRLWLDPGDSVQVLPYGLQRYFDPKIPNAPATYKGPGLALLGVEVEGPVVDEWPSRGHKLIFGDLPFNTAGGPAKGKFSTGKSASKTVEVISKNPTSDSRRLLPGFLAAAFRRPVPPEKAKPYLDLFDAEMKQGATFQQAMVTAATAVLCSPDFLFLREAPGKLDDHALASRLSYFLWRSMPDGELLKLAAAGQLSKPDVLRAQTERLLRDPKAQRFTADFTDAWLDLRNIDFTTPDRTLYPEHDDLLQTSMVKETRHFFDEVLTKNLPASTFLKSDFAILNERLAKHYQVPGVTGIEMRRVALPPGSGRGGLLTQASVLKVSANGTNTSPVVRGIYVLERFMGITPPPPPPGVPAVEPDIRGAKTLREILDKHRSLETCAGCHKLIDPPGFALEGFDVIGGRRDKFRALTDSFKKQTFVDGQRVRYYHGLPVDASGEMTDGRAFKNFEEFQDLLLTDPDRFARCLTEKLLTFGTGREVGLAEREEVARIVAGAAGKKHAFRDLVHAVVQSDVFRSK